MRILIAGGTGFLGRPLCLALAQQGHSVAVLTRRPERARQTLGGSVEALAWEPARVESDQAWVQRVAQVDALVNLSGENVGGRGPVPVRWSPQFKARLRSSRLETTRAIVRALAAASAERRPRVLVNASAIGYYGDRGDELLTEASAPGRDFFSALCTDWEAEASAAAPLGVRVVRVRTGLVLEREAMAVRLLTLASKLGAGGPLGSGRQWWSWIHRDDVVGLIVHALQSEAVRGALNAVAPTPRRMRDFPTVLGQILHRPSLVPAPAFALRLVFGEVADALLLASQRVEPTVAIATSYQFRYTELAQALRAILLAPA